MSPRPHGDPPADTLRPPTSAQFRPCEYCPEPVDTWKPHVRFADDLKAIRYAHLKCWDPAMQEWNPAADAPEELRP